MGKLSGLGQRCYLGKTGTGNGPAYDVSGDIGSIDAAQLSQQPFDVTGIDKSVHERLPAVLDGMFQYSGFWNPATGATVGLSSVMRTLIDSEGAAIWAQNASENVFGFGIVGLVTDSSMTRAANGALTTKASLQADAGYAGWGTIGANATDASNTATHSSIDGGLRGPVLTITTITIDAVAAQVTTSTPHGFVSNQSVNITGTNSTPVINGDRIVTVIDPTNFTVPVVTTIGGNTGSVVNTSSFSGGWFLALLESIGSGSILPKLQDSADGSTWNDLTGMIVGTALTATNSVQLVASTNTAMWRRYIKFLDTGTFTNALWQGIIHRSEP